jgi:soluble lytic murein transglycosylase-like protein
MASQESGGDQSAVSPKDARGVMQLMEGTAKDLGVDRSILEENILGGAKYMGQQLRTFNGNIPDALMAYNAGPTRVMNWIDAGRPLEWKFLKESGPYVEKILQRIENSHKIEEEEKETK